jgi:hypothetical protein
MSLGRPALFIDGPAKGRVIYTAWGALLWYIEDLHEPKTVRSLLSDLLPPPKVVTYYFHKVFLFGCLIHIASMFLNFEDIPTEELVELLLSEHAKKAIEGEAMPNSPRRNAP